MHNIKEAIVLAGGLGTRLRSVVPDLPKCMAPVAGKPFLAHLVHYYKSQGISNFIFSLGYKHEKILSFLENESRLESYDYVVEQEPLGTGGAIKLACSKAKDKDVLVLNGDTFFRVDLESLSKFHETIAADCTLALKPMQDFDRYGAVELNLDGLVTAFLEKQKFEKGLINGGVYALNAKKFINESLPEKFSFEKDYLEKMVGERKITGSVQDEYFIDIGIPEDFERAQTELPKNS
jgi:D-glycero-alpha-D-manno-heptose 1-phosphate guanylyltransferase